MESRRPRPQASRQPPPRPGPSVVESRRPRPQASRQLAPGSQPENSHEPPRAIIPPEVISRPPTAELAAGQLDADSLPPYDTLDRILELYVEQDCSADAIISQGFAPAEVKRVLRLVDLNEYKRRQSPVGVRLTRRGFGRDRRYPITNAWPLGE